MKGGGRKGMSECEITMAELEDHEAIGMMVPALRPLKIGVAVGKGQSAVHALSWALEKLIPPNGSVHLLHVQPPLRFIPNPMGGHLPIDQVQPDIVKTFKDQRLLEADQLLNIYKIMCNKKKVKGIVSYSESDSIQKELVHQVSELGITTLVLGMSSHNVFSRAFKKESISAFVAKNSPHFCTVMVASKGKLISVKEATEASCNSSVSGASDTSVRSIQDGVIMSNGFSPDVLSDSSQSPSECLLSQSRSSNALVGSSPVNVMMRNYSTPPELYKRVPIRSFHQPCISYDSIEHFDRRSGNTVSFDEGNLAESSECASNRAALRVTSGDLNGSTSALAANGSNGGSMDVLEWIRYPEVHVPSPNMEVLNDDSMIEGPLFQGSLFVPQSVSSASFTNGEVRVQVGEYEGCTNEVLQQGRKEPKESEEATDDLQIALRDQAVLQESLAKEIRSHQATRKELERQRKMASMFTNEIKQRMEAERRSHEEIIIKLEEAIKKLERESQLRREAEERASQELAEKLEVLAGLRKQQQRYSEYSFHELQLATNDFHEDSKLGEGGYGPVYRGKLHHTMVAIKVLARDGWRGREEFQKEVELLSRIHHPHMLILLGACPEKGCIVYEYMGNGSLEDRLACKGGTAPLPWYVRFRICLEVGTALLFLHSQPQPIVHRDLKPGNILLDHHFVSKIGDVGIAELVPDNLTFSVTRYGDSEPVGTSAYIDPDYQRTGVVSCESDVYALGIVMLQLLTGHRPAGVTHLVEEAVREGKLREVLDRQAGEWPLTEALDLARLSLKCAEYKRRDRPKLETEILAKLEAIQVVAERAAASMTSDAGSSTIPSFFFCPILQEIMENPHIAADGFTYEYEAIKVWLQANNTSPMTNLWLEHKNLTPNHSVRTAIREWYDRGLILK